MSRRSGLSACLALGVVLAAGAAYSAGLGAVVGEAATTAPAVRVERIPVGEKQCRETADAIRTLLALRADADAFVVGEDAKSGCILLSGPPAAVEDVVRMMGVRTEPLLARRVKHAPGDAVTRVLTLEQTSCESVSRTVREAFRHEPQINVAVNDERNAIVLRGDAVLVKQAEQIIRSLEGAKPPAHVQTTKIIQLKHAQAERVAAVVGGVLSDGCELTCDPRTNALIVRGRPDDLASVEAVVARLDIVIDRQAGGRKAGEPQRRRIEWSRPPKRGETPAPPPAPQAPPPAPAPIEPPDDDPPAGDERAVPTRTR